jgi:hypothetical protein
MRQHLNVPFASGSCEVANSVLDQQKQTSKLYGQSSIIQLVQKRFFFLTAAPFLSHLGRNNKSDIELRRLGHKDPFLSSPFFSYMRYPLDASIQTWATALIYGHGSLTWNVRDISVFITLYLPYISRSFHRCHSLPV